MDSIFLLTGGSFSRIASTPGGRMLLLFSMEIPFLLSFLLWLLIDRPFFARHKLLCSLAVAALCFAGYWLQPQHYAGDRVMVGFRLLLGGFLFSFAVFHGAPRSGDLVRFRSWLGRLARSLLGRFF